MSLSTDLIKAIRGGNLREVVAALDAGAPVELHDGKGDPGLPLAIACFMGHAEIVRELVMRGAKVNLAGGSFAKEMDAMQIVELARTAQRGGKPLLDDPVMRDRLVDYLIDVQALNLNNSRRRIPAFCSAMLSSWNQMPWARRHASSCSVVQPASMGPPASGASR